MTIPLFKMAENGAIFSYDRSYRYCLWREWYVDHPAIAFIGLNPSTADEKDNDATIRKCIGYAKSWGFGKLYMVNLFGYCSRNPINLDYAKDPVGPDNDWWLVVTATKVKRMVACWGSHEGVSERAAIVKELLKGKVKIEAFGFTKTGHPLHPLYLKKTCEPMEMCL